MNKNTLIAHTDSETVFISLTKMEYDDGRESEYTVTVMTNPSYGSTYEDYTMTCKSFYKAWETFKDEYVKHDIGGIYFDDFDATENVGIAWGNRMIIELRNAMECGWSVQMQCGYAIFKGDEIIHSSYDEYSHLADAIEELKKKAAEYKLSNCFISPYYTDPDNLKEIDKRHDNYIRQTMYRDACELEWYCNDSSLMRRYERIYCDEEE